MELPVERTLRRDARANRERLLSAARAVLREHGADAPLDAIARAAGVGIGTLYRHFPDRQALLEALAEEHVAHLVSIVESLDGIDGWEALVSFLEQVVALQERNLELRDALLQAAPSAAARRRSPPAANADRAAADPGACGRAPGRLRLRRPDHARLFARSGRRGHRRRRAGAWRRHLAFAVDGLRSTSPLAPAPGRPLGPTRIAAAHRALSDRHRSRGEGS